MAVIISAALNTTTAAGVYMYVCVCVCVRACMCVTSVITQVQLACPRVQATVQCLGTKRADETAFCWQSGELGHLWSSIPEGTQCEPKHPGSSAHGHVLTKHIWHTRTWCGVTKTGATRWHYTSSVWTQFVFVYMWMCLCTWSEEEASSGVKIQKISLKQCYLYYYPGSPDPAVISVAVDLLLSSSLKQCQTFITVNIFFFKTSVCGRQNVYLCPLHKSLFLILLWK